MNSNKKSLFRGHRLLIASIAACVMLAGTSAPAWAVPSFARQTGMTCSACHTVFPELTPFGREFKLNGYTIDNLRQITGETMQGRQTLSLNSMPPISAMLQVSYTHTNAPVPDSVVNGAYAKSGDVLFPQQASLFYAGKIANDLGAFVQLTYDGAEDHFAIDNTDVRYARYLSTAETPQGAQSNAPSNWLSHHDILFGLSLNNNPTVQDVWNTTQAWGFPYSGSSVAPAPLASTKLDTGGIGQTAAGFGGYLWIDHSVYIELSGYGAAITGGTHPLDSTQANVIRGMAPYWRVGYEHRWGRSSWFIGTYGIDASMWPGNGQPLSGPANHYTDVAVDTQYQYIGEDHLVTFLGTYIHEDQTLNAGFAQGTSANSSDTLHTLKLSTEYYYRRMIGGAAGYFSTSGSHDTLLYPNDGTVEGSYYGSPNSRGYVLEVNYLPFLNTKLQLQYVGYTEFNGSSTSYAGTGRNASANNTLYLLVWLNF